MIAIQQFASRTFLRLWVEDTGATTIEYALIISLVSIGIGFFVPEIRDSLDDLFTRTASGLGAAAQQSQAP